MTTKVLPTITISAICGSILTVLFKKVTQFTMQNELNFLDALSIAVTILLAFYLSYIVEKRNNIERLKKDTIASFFTEYDDLVKNTINKILDYNNNQININSEFKILRIKLNELKEIVESNSLLTGDDVVQKLIQQVNELWGICTGDRRIEETSTQDLIRLAEIKIDILIYKIKLEIND